MIEKLLLTIIVIDPKQLNQKKNPTMYTRAFVEIFN